MRRVTPIALAVVTWFTVDVRTIHGADAPRPNIVLILADDKYDLPGRHAQNQRGIHEIHAESGVIADH